MAKEEWLSFEAVTDLVRKRLNTSIGNAQSVTEAARKSGEVRSYRAADLLLAADDGLTRLWSGARDIRFSKDDLLDWLDRNHPHDKPAAAPGRRGAKAKADWEAVGLALRYEIEQRGVPGPDNDDPKWRCQADVERWAADFLDQRRESVAESTIRDRIRKTLQDIEAGI